MSEFDRGKMFEVLKNLAEGDGFRRWNVDPEIDETFHCSPDEFWKNTWDMYRILREGPLKREMTAAMIMLDMSEYGDEQPIYEWQVRLKMVKKYVSRWGATKRWQTGLRYIAIHYEMTVHVRNWAASHG